MLFEHVESVMSSMDFRRQALSWQWSGSSGWLVTGEIRSHFRQCI